jgi:hypothetical protein
LKPAEKVKIIMLADFVLPWHERLPETLMPQLPFFFTASKTALPPLHPSL